MAQAEIKNYDPNLMQQLRDWYMSKRPKNEGQGLFADIAAGPVSAAAYLTDASEQKDKLGQILNLLGVLPGMGGMTAKVNQKKLSALLKEVPEYYHKFIKEYVAKEAPTTINAFDPVAISNAFSESYRRPIKGSQEHLLATTTPKKFLSGASDKDWTEKTAKVNLEYLRSVLKGKPDFDTLTKGQHPKEFLFRRYYEQHPTEGLGEIPFLDLREPLDDNLPVKAVIAGHEGRHRAKVLEMEFGKDEPYLIRLSNPDLLPTEDIRGSVGSQQGLFSDQYYDLFENPFENPLEHKKKIIDLKDFAQGKYQESLDNTPYKQALDKLHEQAFQGYKSGQMTFDQADEIHQQLLERNKDMLRTLYKRSFNK